MYKSRSGSAPDRRFSSSHWAIGWNSSWSSQPGLCGASYAESTRASGVKKIERESRRFFGLARILRRRKERGFLRAAIEATARLRRATVWTQDSDFAGIEGVKYTAKR